MVTTTQTLTSSWVQITDGIQDYAIHLAHRAGDNTALITLATSTPTETTPSFALKEGEGISSITHPGKVWARAAVGDSVLLVVHK